MPIFIQPMQLSHEKSTQEPTSSTDAELVPFDQQNCMIEKNAWSLGQNIKYANFLAENWHLFVSKQTRRQNKVFRLISQKIRSRTIQQVKSHHQKMLKKHKNIEAIAQFLLNSKKALSYKSRLDIKSRLAEQDEMVWKQERLWNVELQMGISHEFNEFQTVHQVDWFVDL